MIIVRYLVQDVDEAVVFYTEKLGFKLDVQMGPAFAKVRYEDIELWLSGPRSSAARPMPDGRKPEPGGWNRFVIEVKDIEEKVQSLKDKDITFRNEIVSGPGGKQILLEDPSGNPVELFEPV